MGARIPIYELILSERTEKYTLDGENVVYSYANIIPIIDQ